MTTMTGEASGARDSQVLWVSEIFWSLQGEGLRAGRPCLFMRLAGCNLSCPWCDTPYTWKPGHIGERDRRRMTVDELLARAGDDVTLVEVTGGEPLLQRPTLELLRRLCDRGLEVLLDTSGSLSIAEVDPRVVVLMDLKCPSSGQTEQIEWDNLRRLKADRDEVKFVIGDRADYEWAERVIAEHGLAGKVRVVYTPVTPLHLTLREWVLPRQLARWMLDDHSPAALQLQLHRLIWPDALRGTEEGYGGE